MRMVKRIAVGILTAAMALSLLTACGGNDQPSKPEQPSNPGTSQGSGENGGGNNGNNGGNTQKPDQSEENKLPTNWNESKTKAYYTKAGVSDTNIRVEGTINLMDSSMTTVSGQLAVVYAAKGDKGYIAFNNSMKTYKNEKGVYFLDNADGNGWVECKTEEDINSAKSLLIMGQALYKVPENPGNFKAYTQNGFYYEAMTCYVSGATVGYVYAYTADNQLVGICCVLSNSNNLVYFTYPVTISANPSDAIFPKL